MRNYITLATIAFLFICAGALTCIAQTTTAAATDPCAELAAVKERLSRAETRLQDWAQLNRYRADNAQVAPPSKKEARVVFIGDSITDNWDRPGFGGFFPTKSYLNRGISAQTTPQMLVRFRPDVIALQPRAVVILAGTNDLAGLTGTTTLAAIQGNLASMAELARANGVRVVLASLLPVSDYDRDREGKVIIRTEKRPPAQIVRLNSWLKRYAAQHKHFYLDYFSAMVDAKGMLRDELSEDGLHPNAKGYALMTPLAEKAIAEALK